MITRTSELVALLHPFFAVFLPMMAMAMAMAMPATMRTAFQRLDHGVHLVHRVGRGHVHVPHLIVGWLLLFRLKEIKECWKIRV